jgi:hypothetical protein
VLDTAPLGDAAPQTSAQGQHRPPAPLVHCPRHRRALLDSRCTAPLSEYECGVRSSEASQGTTLAKCGLVPLSSEKQMGPDHLARLVP